MALKDSEIVDAKYDRIKIDNERFKAVLFMFGKKEVWLPRSQIDINTDTKTVTLPAWLAEKNEIEDCVE